jgi:hypothetical protein
MAGERNQASRSCGSSQMLLRLLALAAALLPQPCSGAEPALEYDVKAAFVLNFTKFVEWPAGALPDSRSTLEICILGKDPFGRALDEVVQGEAVNGHRLTVRRISQPPVPPTCQVLFIDSEVKEVPKLLVGLPAGILTIGEGDRFAREGGMIALVLDNRRVRFDINPAAAEHSGLKLSSRLLSVARSIVK